jgi:hypothetical protein
MAVPVSRMLNMVEAAEFTGVKYRTWQGYYKIWNVPHFKVGKTTLFREDELAEWLESRHVVA